MLTHFETFWHLYMSKIPGKTATSPTPLGNGGVLSTGPWGGTNTVKRWRRHFCPGGKNDADLKTHTGNVYAYRTNTVKRWRRHFCPGGKHDADLKTHTGNVYAYRKRIRIPETYTTVMGNLKHSALLIFTATCFAR